jgi:hypothetical protein
MYAMDRQWWDEYGAEVNETFRGEKFSCNPIEKHWNVTRLQREMFNGFGNSGAGAISLAVTGLADKVVMLGYDCQKTGGKAHWHGDHPIKLGNARFIERWPEKFAELARFARHVEVINASRETALSMFPRQSLEKALEG